MPSKLFVFAVLAAAACIHFYSLSMNFYKKTRTIKSTFHLKLFITKNVCRVVVGFDVNAQTLINTDLFTRATLIEFPAVTVSILF